MVSEIVWTRVASNSTAPETADPVVPLLAAPAPVEPDVEHPEKNRTTANAPAASTLARGDLMGPNLPTAAVPGLALSCAPTVR